MNNSIMGLVAFEMNNILTSCFKYPSRTPCGVFGDCHDGGGVGFAVNLIVAGDCNGEYFYGGDYADNTRSATNKQVEIVAVLPAAAPGGEDEISAVTGRVFVAKTPERFTYDADGNMTSDGRFTYNWNDENRMVSASNAEVVVTYAYDHKGRMIRKDIMRTGSDTVHIEYTWDGWNIITEKFLTPNSSFLIHNLWGLDLDGTPQGTGGVGGLLAVLLPRPLGEGRGEGGTVYLPCYDANGNVSEYVDSSDGTIAAHYDYSPFGETLVASGPLASTFTHRFSTKPWCQATGFCEYQYRKYNPNLGRWMSRDPMGEKGGVNIYALCGNQVTSNVDSLGNDPRYDYSFLSWSKNITYHNANDTVFKSGKGGSRSLGLTKASEILRSISPKIVKVGECCAKVEHGFGYKISIFQHLLDISAINQVVTKRGYEDILAHENRRGQVYLNGFYKYYGLIAGETELSLKCNTLCRSEGIQIECPESNVK